MRISSVQIFNIANNSMADASEAITRTQEQLSTGRRVLDPSDDPVASTKILALTSELAGIEQFRNNIDIATNNLTIEESVLRSVNNLIIRIQELAIQAGNNATLSPAEYETIASEVDSRISEMQNLLNTQNANGDYIFGGYKSSSAPFTGNASTGFSYNGDEGQQFVRIANNTTVAMSDSGKDLFVDIDSAQNTITTSVSPNNTSVPPITVSVGEIIDQDLYDEFYPEDILISFNADSAISPAGKNFTATERNTGRVIVENQRFTTGDNIEINGTSFRIIGSPVSGVAAIPATRLFGSEIAATFPIDFSAPNSETFEIFVSGRAETFVLDQNITSNTDLANALNSTVNGNAQRLANLGLTVNSTGIVQSDGINFSVRNGSNANVDNILGLNATTISTSNDGVLEVAGDQVFIDSTEKQDILTTMARFSEAMKAYDNTDEGRDVLAQIVNNTITNLGNTQTSVLEVTSQIGARLNTLESTEQLHFDSEIVSRELLSELRDIDYAEAASRLSAQSLILEAAQSSFVRVTRLTLFSQL